jgi:hypothetical protein
LAFAGYSGGGHVCGEARGEVMALDLYAQMAYACLHG